MEEKFKKLIKGEEARKKIMRGVEITAGAVASTLGSKGRNVAIELNWGAPLIVHDGVTVAKNIKLTDPFENMGAQLVIQAAQNTNKEAGDGTTTASILTKAITLEGMKLVSAGVNPSIIRKGINRAVDAVIKELRRISKPIKSFEEMVNIATISAADRDMGQKIAEAVQKVGRNGVVTIKDGNKPVVEVEYKEGLEFDSGFMSNVMINNADEMNVKFEDTNGKNSPYIIFVNDEINNDRLITLLEIVYRTDQQAKVLFVANDVDNFAMASIVVNRVRGNKQIATVKAPDFGDHRNNLLMDMAIITGGKVIGGPSGLPFENVTIDDFGRAERIIVDKDKTIIAGGKGSPEEIEKRCNAIQKLIDIEVNENIKDKLQVRMAKLKGGVAVINVGAPSEQETREIKERVIDAVNATQASIAEGIVPGGGVALLKASKVLNEMMEGSTKDIVGIKIIKDALRYPLIQLVENAGSDDDSGYVLGKILESDDDELGYNVDTEKFENMIKSGIIDPVKVSRSALQNAASVAIMLLTTEYMIAFVRETNKETKVNDDGIGSFTD